MYAPLNNTIKEMKMQAKEWNKIFSTHTWQSTCIQNVYRTLATKQDEDSPLKISKRFKQLTKDIIQITNRAKCSKN